MRKMVLEMTLLKLIKYSRLSQDVSFGFARRMISRISLCLSWFMTALSRSLSSEVVARVVVVDEETRSGMKFISPRREYWFLFTQLNWGDICLMAVGASSLSRKEI